MTIILTLLCAKMPLVPVISSSSEVRANTVRVLEYLYYHTHGERGTYRNVNTASGAQLRELVNGSREPIGAACLVEMQLGTDNIVPHSRMHQPHVHPFTEL